MQLHQAVVVAATPIYLTASSARPQAHHEVVIVNYTLPYTNTQNKLPSALL